MRLLTHEAEVGVGAEVAEVGEDLTDLAIGESEPAGQRAGVLVNRGGGNEAACAHIVGLVGSDDRVLGN